MDGTLVDETWKISRENIDAANYFMENGGIFTYATGRQTPIARDIINQLTPNAPVICYNGAAIYDYSSEKFLWTSSIDPDAELIIEDLLENCPVTNIEINTADGIYTLKDIDYTIPRYDRFTSFFTKADSPKSIAHPWFKIVIVVNDSYMPALRQHIQSQPYFKNYQFSQSATFLYEILNLNVNKGTALPQLREILGNKHKIIAVGDNENDVDLVKSADIGFSVGDGSPLLLSQCSNLTVPLKDHVLVDIIDRLEKNLT